MSETTRRESFKEQGLVNGKFEVKKKLGKGRYGDVVHLVSIEDGAEFAAKIFKKANITSETKELVLITRFCPKSKSTSGSGSNIS